MQMNTAPGVCLKDLRREEKNEEGEGERFELDLSFSEGKERRNVVSYLDG